ncbi:MAG: hypothetical protein ACM3Y8_11450 [Byssovorax cruenta]
MRTFIKLLVALVVLLATFSQPRIAWAGEKNASAANHGFTIHVVSADATSVRLQWTPINGATEYEVARDGYWLGSTVAVVGSFSDFGLRPRQTYTYTITALNTAGAQIARSAPATVRTTGSATVRTKYTILALAFNPEQTSLVTEEIYLKHRIQFLELASLGSAEFDVYQGHLISINKLPAAETGTNYVNYTDLVTRRDLPELNGYSIVDLVEQGTIDHVWVTKSAVDFGENVLIGNRFIQGDGLITENSWFPVPVKSSRSFFVNAFSPDERSYDAYAHMVEGIMTSISDGHPETFPRNAAYEVYTNDYSSTATVRALLNKWEEFRLADGWNGPSTVAYASSGNGNIGSSHFPPTTARLACSDYCYYDIATWQRYIDSSADNWLTFPDFNQPKRKLNGYDFGAFNYYAEGDTSYSAAFGDSPELHFSLQLGTASFHQWWFAHLPHNPGVSKGMLNNWWPYLYDFNRFDGSFIDYKVVGFPEIPTRFRPSRGEYGTDARNAEDWGYWHSQNGFSPGGKAANLTMVSKASAPRYVNSGNHALQVSVENTQYWEDRGFGRNDVFYPISRNAHWTLPNLAEVRFSVKLGLNPDLITNTNPIVQLYKNGGNRIELVPRANGIYANLFQNTALQDANGWYAFTIPLAGNATWEKNIIGYVDPTLTASQKQAAKDQLERDILADLNYIEISIRSTTSKSDAPYDAVTYYIDGLQLVTR